MTRQAMATFGKCSRHGTVVRMENWEADSMLRSGGGNVYCLCGRKVEWHILFGRQTDKKCDARCTSATGFICDCQCGGKNHGAA